MGVGDSGPSSETLGILISRLYLGQLGSAVEGMPGTSVGVSTVEA